MKSVIAYREIPHTFLAIRAIAIGVAAFIEQVLATVMDRFLDWARARRNSGD